MYAEQRRQSAASSDSGKHQVVMPVYGTNQMQAGGYTLSQNELQSRVQESSGMNTMGGYTQVSKNVSVTPGTQYYSGGVSQTAGFGMPGGSYTSYVQGPTTSTTTVTTNQYGTTGGLSGMTSGMGTGMTSGMGTGMTSGMVSAGGQTQYQNTGMQQYTTGGMGQYTTGGATTMMGGDYSAYSGQRRVSGTTSIAGKEYVTSTRVVGHEYGEQRVISTSQRVDESRASILSERFVEHEIKVPKKIVREEVIEKVIVVPERLLHEEVIEEVQKVREKIIEIAKPIIQEKIIEVPEIEYVEKLVEVPEKIFQEKIREVPRIEYQERIIEVPKIITQEKIVEVPDIQYREVPYERVVEVPEIREEIVLKEIPVPQYVDKPVPQYVDVEVTTDVERNIPVPVEAITTFEYRMPRLRPRYNKVSYPVYLPRFIEVPVALELLNADLIAMAEKYLAQVKVLSGTAASLCEIENLAANIMKADFQSHLASADLQTAIMKAWQSGILQFNGPQPTIQATTSTYTTSGYSANAGAINQSYIAGSPAYVTRTTGKTHHRRKSGKKSSSKARR